MTDIKNININKFELKLADTDDPVAQKVEWEPARGGGSNFKAQKLFHENNKIQVKKTFSAILFYGIFLIVGLGAWLVGIPFLGFVKASVGGGIMMFFLGLIFGGIGFYLLSRKEYCLDKNLGQYYKGKFNRHTSIQDKTKQGSLTDIYAIQLISERIHSQNQNYTSYELNLVLHDAQRINLMDHGNGRAVQEDAKTIAEFLNVPIWQAEY